MIRRPLVLTILFRLSIVMVAVAGISVEVTAQSPPATAAPSSFPSPQHPITLEQLRTFSGEIHSIEPTRELTLEAAEQQRKTLPPWFPASVWDEIEKKMATVDIAKVQLPVYQRYLSAENADAMILFYSGPLGERLGTRFVQREAASAEAGTSGAATTSNAVDQTRHSDDVALAAKRLNELSPEDQARFLAARQAVMASWKTISDELAATYDKFMNDFVQTEINNHHQELAAAQTAYLKKSSAKTPAQH